ncbi:translation initiation factor IF-2 isoform X2 [Triticum aestivum]|uniref:translation initiation factor IF-2 isoform X2 n=1 Tax=Triticum aestivum TaxID=4565 RepID=UPI001D034B95|nr:translation initiation factor IF-2-like isoform X2 [Triticum aestivum]
MGSRALHRRLAPPEPREAAAGRWEPAPAASFAASPAAGARPRRGLPPPQPREHAPAAGRRLPSHRIRPAAPFAASCSRRRSPRPSPREPPPVARRGSPAAGRRPSLGESRSRRPRAPGESRRRSPPFAGGEPEPPPSRVGEEPSQVAALRRGRAGAAALGCGSRRQVAARRAPWERRPRSPPFATGEPEPRSRRPSRARGEPGFLLCCRRVLSRISSHPLLSLRGSCRLEPCTSVITCISSVCSRLSMTHVDAVITSVMMLTP